MKDWTFETKEIAKGFSKHVNQHLPWYPLATNLIKCIVENYIPYKGTLLDIGASRGNITLSLHDLLVARRALPKSYEVSEEMVEEFEGVGDIYLKDAEDIDEHFDVAICFLTLMFNSVEKRARILDNLRSKLRGGGCIVIVEKFDIEDGGYASTVQRRMTMRQKLDCGVSAEDIVDKELSLAGVQRPLRIEEIDGFKYSEFFRVGEFRGFILCSNI
jgi:tRNA (cmo5U34)-methyltransferase